MNWWYFCTSVCLFGVICVLCVWIVSSVVTIKPAPVASHALPPQPARPTATATAAPIKKVAPPAVAPALPKVNIPAAEKGRWKCDWQRLKALTAVTDRGLQLALTAVTDRGWWLALTAVTGRSWQLAVTSLTGRDWRVISNRVLSYARIQFKIFFLLFSCGTSHCDEATQGDW